MKQFYLLVLAFLLFNYSFGQSKYAKDVSSIENLTNLRIDLFQSCNKSIAVIGIIDFLVYGK